MIKLKEQISFQRLNPDYAVKFAFANELPFQKIAAQVLFILILSTRKYIRKFNVLKVLEMIANVK